MINKIGNWVFGSFFRTIGRLLVFILLGVIVANLVDFGALIDNFRITDLFFEKVNASSGGVWLGEVVSPANTWNYSTLSPFYVEREMRTYGTYANSVQFETSFGQFGVDKFYINGYITSVDLDAYYSFCTERDQTNGYCKIYQDRLSDIQFQLWLGDNRNQCKIEYNIPATSSAGQTGYLFWNAECYSDNSTTTNSIGYRVLMIDPNDGTDSARTYYFGINRQIYFSASDSQAIIQQQQATTNAITNQTQQQQQQHQELMDDNTTEADTEGQDFINNFSNNSHGLTGIITAPLSAIQSLASATCSPLVLPLPFMSNKSLTLPCMNSIYTQYFGAFYTMYQGIILALISYWVCVRLFTLVKGFKDPEDDKIEVMDL